MIKRSAQLFMALSFIAMLSSCGSSKKGGGCDCPGFGYETEQIQDLKVKHT